MKLLVVMPTKYLGNMVISLQAIAAILADHAADDAILLVDDAFEDLTRLALRDACRILTYPRRSLGKDNLLERARQYWRFIRSLRHEHFDTAVDLDGTVVSARIMSLARARDRIGPTFAKRTGPYTRIIVNDRDSQHCFDDFTIMADAIGTCVIESTYLTIPHARQEVWDSIPIARPDGAKKLACIHPCATKYYKQWDIGRFAALADWLIDAGWQVTIVGAGSDEKDRVDALLAQMRHEPVNAHGKLSLVQLVCLLQHADLFVGNDSGPMHLAAASGVSAIALFGPTELHRWRPRAGTVQVLKGQQPCSPLCQPEACLCDYRCLSSLSVEQVQQIVVSQHA